MARVVAGDPASQAQPPRRQLLTTSEAARLLGVSRPTIVAMCDSGDLPFTQVGTHRRIDPELIQALRERTRRKPTAARRSLWLSHAAAGVLVQDPERSVQIAQQALDTMVRSGSRGMSKQWLQRWQQLLEGPVEPILEMLTGSTVEHDEMRQHSPFTATLSPEQRQAVLDAFSAAKTPRRRSAPAGATSQP